MKDSPWWAQAVLHRTLNKFILNKFKLISLNCRYNEIITNPHEILLFSVCIKSTIVVFNMAKQLSEENGGGPFC